MMSSRINDQRKRYGVILADPPWQCNSEGWENHGWGRISQHYDLMHDLDIADLPIEQLAADNCVLILWTTWTHIEKALAVMRAWGFEYKAGFPWVKFQNKPAVNLFGEIQAKPAWGLGMWVRGCSEPVLIGRRGEITPGPDHHFLGLLSERFEHSRKPDNIHEYAESFPGPYLELFARRERPGWSVWGNEVESTIELDEVRAWGWEEAT